MEISWYKKWFSYIFPIPLEKLEGYHNPYLEVRLSRGRYQLSTENAIYSHEDLYSNYTKAFRKLSKHLEGAETVLILGLGLGSIPYMLEKKFAKKLHYTAVEIDETVIYLANKYSLKQLNSHITFVCADAALFVPQCQETFDLICVDLFLDDEIPETFKDQSFLEQVARLLNENGLLMYNCLGAIESDKSETSAFFEGTFKKVFPEASFLKVDRNLMLINKSRI